MAEFADEHDITQGDDIVTYELPWWHPEIEWALINEVRYDIMVMLAAWSTLPPLVVYLMHLSLFLFTHRSVQRHGTLI